MLNCSQAEQTIHADRLCWSTAYTAERRRDGMVLKSSIEAMPWARGDGFLAKRLAPGEMAGGDAVPILTEIAGSGPVPWVRRRAPRSLEQIESRTSGDGDRE